MTPYLIDTPAVISFSGGRTSGFMLRQIIDAFGGTLPDDVRVCFNNTGLEHPKTYDFVRDVETHWGGKIHWLEYRVVDGDSTFAEVTFDTASRNGEPFEALIHKRNFLPNPVARFCTVELKIKTSERYAHSLGWAEFTNVIGLRADEHRRVSRMRSDGVAMPMADVGHTIDDVLAFWKAQDFDLELPGGDNSFGNCVGCFLKGPERLMRLMREEPVHFDWWARAEKLALSSASGGATFRSDRPTYAQMLEMVRTQPVFAFDGEDAIACACTE